MFYQYLRGKQHELLAVRAVVPQLAAARQAGRVVVPIIEPVRTAPNALATATEAMLTSGGSLIVVTNPIVGAALGTDLLQTATMAPLYQSAPDRLIPAYIVLSTTPVGAVQQFLARYPGAPVAIVHAERCPTPGPVAQALAGHTGPVTHLFHDAGTGGIGGGYRTQFGAAGHVVLRDGFRRREKNAEYPEAEFFTELHQTYRAAQPPCAGFGDFSTVGDYFSDKGGPAYAVTIHLTYQHTDGTIWVRHFVSDRTETQADPDGKFLEALAKLVAFVQQQPAPVPQTAAVAEFLDLHQRQHFPALGKVKELSMRHHLELMATLV